MNAVAGAAAAVCVHSSTRKMMLVARFFAISFLVVCASAVTQTATFSPSPTSVDDATLVMVPTLSFASGDFGCAADFDITDVNVDVTFDKSDFACGSSSGGNTFLDEISFSISSSAGASTVLVDFDDYVGGATTFPSVTVTYDKAAGTPVGGAPVTGSAAPVSGDLDLLNEMGLSGVTYTLTAGDSTIGDPLCMFSWAVTATATCVVGGGGDPHLVGPYIPKLELHRQLEITEPTREVGNLDVVLLASSEVTFMGNVRAQPTTEKYFFTSFAVASSLASLSVGFEVQDGRAFATIEQGATTFSCAQGDSFEVSLGDSAYLLLDCSNSAERAQANSLMRNNFSSHIEYVAASIAMETRHFSSELFFVQKDNTMAEFGFFDFSLRYHTDEELAGVFTNSHAGHDEAARAMGLSDEEVSGKVFSAMGRNLRNNVAFV